MKDHRAGSQGRMAGVAFDHVAEGARYGLAEEDSIEIWERVRAEALDEDAARDRFREVAERVQRRGGRLHVAPGKVTRVEAELYGRDRNQDVFADIAPGKRTLVEAEMQRARRRGMPGTLPHLDEVMALQRATRVSGEGANAEALQSEAAPIAQALGLGAPRLELGAEAAAVTGARGARGVAMDDATFIDPAIDAGARREVLAHELVHQAQAKLPAGADRGRDAAEAEAHAIAARYAATGELAQPKLAIDLSRPAADTDARKPGVTAAMYLHLHASQFLRVVRERVAAVAPRLPRGLTWHDYSRFADLFARAFAARVDGFEIDKAGALQEIVYPANVYDAVDSGRVMLGFDKEAAQHPGDLRYGQLGLRDWSAAAGAAFAHVIESALRQSVTRMAGRYLATAERKGVSGGSAENPWSPVEANELVMSHPMDGLVGRVLPAFGVVEIRSQPSKPKTRPAPKDAAAQETAATDETPRTKNQLRVLDLEKFEWQGARDPSMWNWLKVAEPDASAEEVAETLFGTGAGDASTYAYGITAMPPYFGLPKRWARNLPVANTYAPKGADSDEQPHDNALAFAHSSLAETAALQQSGGGDPSGKQLGAAEMRELLQQSATQIAHIDPIITAWGERAQLGAVRAFLAGHQRSLAADPARERKWGTVLRHQQEVLYEVATQLDQLHSQIGASGKLDPSDPQLAPYRDVVAAYARAAAASHLATTSRGLLAVARDQQRMLIARVITDAARGTELSVQGMRAASVKGHPEQRDLTARSDALAAGAAQFQRDLLAGKAPDPEQADELIVTADELSFKARNQMFIDMLATVEKAATDVNEGYVAKVANSVDTDIYTLPPRANSLASKLMTIRAHHDTMIADVKLLAFDQPNQARMTREGRRRALANARLELAAVEKEETVKKFLEDGYREIDDAQTRTMILQVALMIGVSLVSAGIGNAVTAGLRGLVLGRSAQAVAATAGLSRTAIAATRLGGLFVESVANTAAQTAILNKPVGETFLGDFLANLGTSMILHGLRSGVDASAMADDAIRAVWKQSGGRFVLEKSLQITGETLVGAATSYVLQQAATHVTEQLVGGKLHIVNRITGEKLEPETVTNWYIQGATIAIGRFINGALAKQLQRVQALSAIKGWEAGRKLADEVRALKAATARHEQHLTYEGGLALVKQRGELLKKEQQRLAELAADPKLARQLEGGLAHLQAENAASLAAHPSQGFRRLMLEGAGLRPTIAAHTWSGTPEEIAKAIADVRKAGLAVRDKGTADGVRTLAIDDTEIRIHEIFAASGSAEASAAKPTHNDAHDAKSTTKPKSDDTAPKQDGAKPQRVPEAESTKRHGDESEDETGPGRRKLPHFPIAIHQIEVAQTPKDAIRPSDSLFSVDFYVTHAGKEFWLGGGKVFLKNGVPVDSPDFTLKGTVSHNDEEHAVKIYDDVMSAPGSDVPAPVGRRTSLTAFTLKEFISAYKQRFGSEPDALFALLTESNRLIFQIEYVKLRSAGVDEMDALIEAVKRTPMGRHRIEAGYTEFSVDAGKEIPVDLGKGVGRGMAPHRIEVHARKPT